MAATPTIFDELRNAFGEAQDIDGVRIVGRIPAADCEENKAILARVADAVVHLMEEITDFEVTNLRDLIKAVESHPDVSLVQESNKDNTGQSQQSRENVTQLRIRGGRILSAHLGINNREFAHTVQIFLDLSTTFAHGAVFEHTTFAADAWFMQAVFAGDARLSNSKFAGQASFCGVTFKKSAHINNVSFRAAALFDDVGFNASIEFNKTTFGAGAYFRDARFKSVAAFGEVLFESEVAFDNATFAGHTLFGSATFKGDASFNQARFSATTRFDNATFAGCAWFDGTTFVADVWFDGACFKSPTWFGRATFADNVWFDTTEFVASVGFDDSVFVRKVSFSEAAFKGPVRGDLRTCTVRQATAALAANARELALPIPAVRSKDFWRFRARLAGIWFDWFGWHRVRALGKLAILNRVSLIALLGVPVLATLYVPLREALDKHRASDGLNPDAPIWLRLAVATLGNDPHLGLTITLTFLAAVCVTLGLLIYQIFTPDEIKKHDEEQHVRDVEARYPEGQPQRDDGLRRALERLEDQSQKRPNRHPSFVKHHGDLIWMPPRDKIEWFRDNTLPTVDKLKAIVTSLRKDAGQPDRDAECIDPKAREGFVPGAERARICIEEGARAEYWLRAREYVGWAWVSMGLYGVGLSALLFILLRQVWLVTKAAGWH